MNSSLGWIVALSAHVMRDIIVSFFWKLDRHKINQYNITFSRPEKFCLWKLLAFFTAIQFCVEKSNKNEFLIYRVNSLSHTQTHAHTHTFRQIFKLWIYIYIYIYIYVYIYIERERERDRERQREREKESNHGEKNYIFRWKVFSTHIFVIKLTTRELYFSKI